MKKHKQYTDSAKFFLIGIIGIILTLIAIKVDAQFYDDTWGGKDKFAHFSYCTGISYISGAICYEAGVRVGFDYGAEIGIATAIGIGIWKETQDHVPSYQDLTYDVLGAFAGYALNKVYEKHNGMTDAEKLQLKLKRNERQAERKRKRIEKRIEK